MKKSFVCLTAAVALALGSASALASEGCDKGEIVIKFSHVTAAKGHPKGEAAALLAERVNREMDGKVCMQVYPNKQLYNDKKVLEALLLGDVQMAAPSLSKFEKYTKQYRIFDLPFMFKDIDAVDRFQNSETGQKLKNAMRKKGLQGLAFWHNGMKQMSANRPLIHPSDAKGLKFRIMSSDVLKAQFEALGAIPQNMAFSEVYGALQSGVVDGQENTWSNIYTKKFFEVQDGVTETNHGVLDYLVVTSTEFWDGLPSDVRNQLERIIAEVTADRNKVSTAINEQNKQKIIAAGSPVRTLTSEQRQEWVEALKPVWKQFEGDVGADVIAAAQKANEG